jgi:hypothetical protein
MNNLKYYDILGHLVPGFVFLSAVSFILVQVGTVFPEMPGGDGVKLLVVTALAYYVGHLLSVIAGVIQPILYFLWGGKPSRRILIEDTSYIDPSVRERTRVRLAEECGLSTKLPAPRRERAQYLDTVYAHAQSICDKGNFGRVADFNASYALHRSLCVAMIFAGVLSLGIAQGTKSGFSVESVRWLIIAYFVAGVISFFVARKRGYYFVREVLRMYQVHREETPK